LADEYVDEERFEELLKLQKEIQKEMRRRNKKKMPIDCIACWKGARELNTKGE
jgi:hypothetical protein